MDNKYNSLHLAQIYRRIFVLGHYLLLEAHSFPQATYALRKLLASRREQIMSAGKYPSIFLHHWMETLQLYYFDPKFSRPNLFISSFQMTILFLGWVIYSWGVSNFVKRLSTKLLNMHSIIVSIDTTLRQLSWYAGVRSWGLRFKSGTKGFLLFLPKWRAVG